MNGFDSYYHPKSIRSHEAPPPPLPNAWKSVKPESEIPDLPCVDAIVAGPPCQDYSSGGHRVEGARAMQTLRFARTVARRCPRFFAMENVAPARRAATYARAKDHLHGQGYGLTEVVLRACHYGVPQHRPRLILVGELGGKDDALRDLLRAGRSARPMTIRDHCGDNLAARYIFRHYYKQRCVWSADEVGPTISNEYRRGRMPSHYTRRGTT